MTQHSANQMRFDPRPRPSFQRFGGGNDFVRVLLVAIHHSPQPAAFLGSHPLQRLQVLLAAAGEGGDLDPLSAMARLTAGATPQLLPQLPAASAAGAHARLVQGEILSDDDGRFYEKIGHRIHPLQRLFSGPRGEVLELPSEAQAEQRAPSPQAPDVEASKTEAQAKPRAEAPPHRQQFPQRAFRRPQQPPREAFGTPFGVPIAGGRSIIREPLPLEGGTTNAGRQPVPREGGIPNGAPNASRQPVPREGGIPNGAPNASRQSVPREGAPNASRQPVPREGGTPYGAPDASRQSVPREGGAPNAGRQSVPREGGNQNASARYPKTTIPEQWVKPWEFQISREEALYDMLAAASSRNFIRDLTNRFGHRQSWRKWQALLAGKNLDEQLWAVRPPRGMIARAAVRDWARQTLEQAGYDARVMLAEWEIFWRRKGL